jgi:hypothetical protein
MSDSLLKQSLSLLGNGVLMRRRNVQEQNLLRLSGKEIQTMRRITTNKTNAIMKKIPHK